MFFFVTEAGMKLHFEYIFVISNSNQILALNHIASYSLMRLVYSRVTSFITQPAWHSWKFDLACDLRENITHSCGLVIIDFSMMSIQILFPAILKPTPSTEASVLMMTVCLGHASDKQAAIWILSNISPMGMATKHSGIITGYCCLLGFISMFKDFSMDLFFVVHDNQIHKGVVNMTIPSFFYAGVTWYTTETGAESMWKYYLFDKKV